MDPHYDCGHEKDVLTLLAHLPCVTEDTLVISEASLNTDFSYAAGLGFEIVREKNYKTNKHIFMKKRILQ